jgi:glyoxylase-like metal-dependent hydrolase (beta-lactamase superfamily II)
MSNQVDSYNFPYDFYPFRVGNFECLALCDGGAQYTLESMVTNASRAEVQTYLQTHGLPTEFIATPYTYLYVNTAKHKVLVDLGAGNLLPTTGRLLQSMEKAGVSPQSIDSIFISHAHPDHVGGALDSNGNLTFSNATYFIWQKEWDFWFSERAFDQVGEAFITFARQKLAPLKDKISFLQEEKEVLPGVAVLFAPGHTPGHMVVSFQSGGERLLYTADTVLHPLHLEQPEWVPVYDILPDAAKLSKNHIFDLAAETKSLALGQHFPPFPNLGYIVKEEPGWRWQPIKTDWDGKSPPP